MKYDVELEMLESKGIIYHRKISDYLSKKIDSYFKSINKPSILIVGEKDLIISRQLAKKHAMHILTKKSNEDDPYNSHIPNEDIPKETRIIPVTHDTFGFEEYDLIIFLFIDFETFKKVFANCKKAKFIFIPNFIDNIEESKKTKRFLTTNDQCFSLEYVNYGNSKSIIYSNI